MELRGVLWRACRAGAVAGFVSEADWVGVRPELRSSSMGHRVIRYAPILRRYVAGRTLEEALNLTFSG